MLTINCVLVTELRIIFMSFLLKKAKDYDSQGSFYSESPNTSCYTLLREVNILVYQAMKYEIFYVSLPRENNLK
jgi:hypothetical protein